MTLDNYEARPGGGHHDARHRWCGWTGDGQELPALGGAWTDGCSGLAAAKMPVLWRGDYEFDTRIFDATAVVASGAAITTVDAAPQGGHHRSWGRATTVGLVGMVARRYGTGGWVTSRVSPQATAGSSGSSPAGASEPGRRRKGERNAMSVPARVLNELFTKKLASSGRQGEGRGVRWFVRPRSSS
jgi:hypothetical protein